MNFLSNLFGKEMSLNDVENLKTKQDVSGLIKALNYKDGEIRRSAATALVAIGEPSVKPLVKIAIDGWGSDQTQMAFESIIQLGDKAVEPLIANLQTAMKKNDKKVLMTTTYLLGEIGDVRAIQPLISTLGNKKWFYQHYGDVAHKTTWDPWNQDARTSTWEPVIALAKIGPPAVEPLLDFLQKGDKDAQHFTVVALGKIGDVKAVESLIAALDKDISEAPQALANIGDPRAVPPLMEKFKGRISRGATAHLDALVKIGKPSIEPAIAALVDPNIDTRAGAVMLLARIGESAVEPLLVSIKTIENQYIQKLMSRLLEKAKKEEAILENGIWAAKNCAFHVNDLKKAYKKKHGDPIVGMFETDHNMWPSVVSAREVIALIQEYPPLFVALIAALHQDEQTKVIYAVEDAIKKLN